MDVNKNIPTTFAKSLANAAGITIDFKAGQNHVDATDRLERLKAFQQMAVATEFDECLIAFHGQELSDEQKEVLKVIYKSTKPWMLGQVVGVLLNRLESAANRDFAESVRTIVEQLTKDENGNGGPSNKMKGMLIKLTKEA